MTATPTRPLSGRRVLRVVHHHPGRLRVRALVFEDRVEVADRVREELASEAGVASVEHSARTGSLLVVYEPGHAEPNALLELVRSAAGLDAIVDDVNGGNRGAHIRSEIASGAHTASGVVLELTGGRADLRTVVAGALFAGSVYSFVKHGDGGRMPRWDNLLWWSYGILTGDSPQPANDASE